MHAPTRIGGLGVFAVLLLVVPGFGQQSVEPRLVYERVVCIVPMTGAGTYHDPRRPAYVPDHLLPRPSGGRTKTPFDEAREKREAPKAIVGFKYELSDDGEYALVEFQATDRSAFTDILEAAKTPGASSEPGPNRNALEGGFDLKVFEVGKASSAEIEEEFRKRKANFDLKAFQSR